MAGVYTIPPGEAFVDVLARGLDERVGDDPLALSDMLVLLPTRRAVRALREAFLRRHDGRPRLLPTMQPIGDVDEDSLVIGAGDTTQALTLPPAIGELRRLLLLAQAVGETRRTAEHGVAALSAPQAVLLARELSALLDQLQIEGVPLSALQGLVPDAYAEHWQDVLRFLQVLEGPWQQILKIEDALDPADRRNRLLRALAERWRLQPPRHPVIAAGSTGSIPATADLLAVIAALPAGAVVLPGLDIDAGDDIWSAIEPSHPQFGMKSLLEQIGVTRDEVAVWPTASPSGPRNGLLREAMRPGPTTDAWRTMRPLPPAAVAGLRRIDCADAQQEAGVIALLMRQTLETPQRTAALVTPDRDLARRVASELQRWGVDVDDSAGTPLATTPPGAFLRLTAEMLSDDIPPTTLLAVLKHPLTHAGRHRGDVGALVRALDAQALRGPRPAPGFTGVLAALRQASALPAAAIDLVLDLQRMAEPFAALLSETRAALPDLLDAHLAFAEDLACDADGRNHLWEGEDGEMAMTLVGELRLAAEDLRPIAPAGYAALLGTLMEGRVVRPRWGRHPRLHIWGPLEARMQQADLLILGGLNDGSWPAEADVDAWLSRPMRAQLGLPAPERRIGLAAHDFVQAAAAADVVLTRADKQQGTPTVPSRWLLRLEQVLAAGGCRLDRELADNLRGWQRQLDAATGFSPAPPPACRPPLKARPREMSVTRVETWMRDSYQIYARYVLGLKALDALEADPGAAERGTAVHEALERFVAAYPDDLPADAYDALLAFGRMAFGAWLDRPGVRAFWWPRFERIARWVIDAEHDLRAQRQPLRTEVRGETTLTGPAGPFVLRATADRIDRLNDGRLAIIDYKTGTLPSQKEIREGDAPQLPLEAAIAAAGGFADIAAGEVGLLSFWRLSGGRPAGAITDAKGTPADLAATSLARLQRLIDDFDNVDTPYRSRPRPAAAPRFSDYDHLARVKEWTAGGPGDL